MKRILVAPLNWGLGHAARCIPIINLLMNYNYEPILASDGAALDLLKKEFPDLKSIPLPSYNIKYAKKGTNFKFKLLQNSPKMLRAISSEQMEIRTIIKKYKIDGIISDNRFGVYSRMVPSVFLTHQLNVLSGNTTWLSTKLHQLIMKKFDECWIPDVENEPNLSGSLGHSKSHVIPTRYLGVISRLKKFNIQKVYDLLVLLSGPEPQRSLLEEQLLEQLKSFSGSILIVQGKIETQQKSTQKNLIKIVNFMLHRELEKAINQSHLILSRSGYSTILDLAKLEKKAFFIPTPGQFEQEYLADRLDKEGIAPFCIQGQFTIEQLQKTHNNNGFSGFNSQVDFEDLFSLFQGK